MKFLKGLVLGLLNFLLFLSLTVFGLAFMLNSTILNPDFVVAEVDKLEISSVVREITQEQISAQLPEEAWFLKEAMYNIISDQEPWLKEQARAAVYSGYDFLLGKSERLSVSVSLDSLKESLRESTWQVFLQNLPPPLSGLPQDQLKPYFDQYYQQFAVQIPSEVGFDKSSIPPDVMEQIIRARQGIGYFQTGYYVLIGFLVLLILGVVLINRNVKDITRGLGITFLTYGVLEYVGIFLAKYFVPFFPTLSGIPSSLQMWVLGVYDNLFTPLEMFSLGCLIGGVVLIIVSFVYRPRTAE